MDIAIAQYARGYIHFDSEFSSSMAIIEIAESVPVIAVVKSDCFKSMFWN